MSIIYHCLFLLLSFSFLILVNGNRMSADITSKIVYVKYGFLTFCLKLCPSQRSIKKIIFHCIPMLHNVHVWLVYWIFVLCNYGMDKKAETILMYLDAVQDITPMLKHSNNVKPHVLLYFIFKQTTNWMFIQNTVFRIYNHLIGRQRLLISLQYYFYCYM